MNVRWQAAPALSPDVEVLQHLASQAIRDLSAEFTDQGGFGLLSELTLEVHVHAGDQPEAEMSTCVRDGRPMALLELLAPSRHPRGARTIVDEPKDEAYVHKTLVHELSILFLWQITRGKRGGWSFFSGPDWFVEGYEEYLSLTHSSDHSRTVTLPLYRQTARTRSLTGDSGTLDPYVDGALVLQYMHERHGRDQVLALLCSEQSAFSDALRATLGCTETELFSEWRQWLAA